MTEFTHLDDDGHVRMVEVGEKDQTKREAIAEALITMSEATSDALFSGALPKGDALASIRLAGIMAAKRTPDLIPLCHPIAITGVEVKVEQVDIGARILATVRTTGRTGVEMEAMTAASVAALTLYDMVKGVERGVEVSAVRLLLKDGGKGGRWER